jgi:hypothetical protein
MKKSSMFNPIIDHKPGKGFGEWIGIEIECFTPYERLGLPENQYDDAQRVLSQMVKQLEIPGVTLKTDGSVRSKTHGKYYEFEVTVVYKYKDPMPLKKLCAMLVGIGTEVNKTCGLHVHLDCRDLSSAALKGFKDSVPRAVRRRAEKIENMLPLMLKMVSKSRRNNTYCAPRMSDDRTAINIGSFYKHKSIEIRLHQGSINYEKISKWVELLYRASRTKKEMDVANVTQLKKYLGRPPKGLTTYVQERIKTLSEKNKAKKKAAKKANVDVGIPEVVALPDQDPAMNMDGDVA